MVTQATAVLQNLLRPNCTFRTRSEKRMATHNETKTQADAVLAQTCEFFTFILLLFIHIELTRGTVHTVI
jgi:hypothetical protein